MTRPHRPIVLVGFDGMELLDIVGPAEMLNAATQLLARDGVEAGYRIVTASLDGGAIHGSSGMRLMSDVALVDVETAGLDTIVVGGGVDFERFAADPRLQAALARASRGARRTCSVCTGAFALAAAGLLDGRHATTHWAFGRELARRYPSLTVTPDRIFVRDGPVTTSAGFSAGMDLALALIEDDHGPELARTVARWTVMFLQRPGGQSQFSERLALPPTLSSPLRAIVDAVTAEPAADHCTAALAQRVSVSERHLRRIFTEQAHTTPARFVERVRVEAARDLLETSTGTIESIALQCGFGTPETMRRTFLRVLAVGPADYRARFRTALDVAA